MAFTKITAAGIGSTETVTLDGLSVINNGSFGGNLTVGGVLTYEDVTNVDSVGLITARNGIVVGSGITLSKDGDIFATGITTVSGNVKVGTGITLSPDGDGFFTGVVTATSFVGDGSGLTNAGPSLTGSTNNTIVTVTGANAIQGESNLTFDGDTLLLKSSTDGRRVSFAGDGTSHYMKYDNTLGGIILNGYGGITFETNGTNERVRIDSSGRLVLGTPTANASDKFTVHDAGDAFASIRSDTEADNRYQVLDFAYGTGDRSSSNMTASIGAKTHSQSGGTLKADLAFSTNSGDSVTQKLVIKDTGNVEINDGDLVISTCGHGIDFSATGGPTSGTGTSELLDDYEEGTFTPNIQGTGSNNSKTYTYQLGKYTRIGNIVHCEFRISWSNAAVDSGTAIVNGLPFVIDSNIATGAAIGSLACNNINFVDGNQVTAAWEAANGQQYIYFLVTYDNGGWNNLTTGAFNNTGSIRGAVTYRVA